MKFISIAILFLLSSCAPAPKKTSLKINIGALGTNDLVNPLIGGAYLEVVDNITGDSFRLDLDETYTMEIDYGVWTFHLVGWEGDRTALAYTGNIMCGSFGPFDTTDLEVFDASIDVTISKCRKSVYQRMIYKKVGHHTIKQSGDANSGFGEVIEDVGDVNGDGHSDLAVGSRLDDSGAGGNNSGRVQIVSGKDSTLLKEHYGEDNGDQFGSAITTLGDINGDGMDDYAIAAPLHDTVPKYNIGAVYLYSGKDHSLLNKINGQEKMDTLVLTLKVLVSEIVTMGHPCC